MHKTLVDNNEKKDATENKDPPKHVFHIVTKRRIYAAMRMWFLANSSQASVQVKNIEEFTWLSASYCPVLKQLVFSFHDRLLLLSCFELDNEVCSFCC
ncbi:hypothetical protein C5167_001028 [Papaver somniferum]|uniref:Uncharacterized protein n=1 Tax=Papaver somniferum TaxID=3469 RepID=A0A4Y7KX18_PAPSO|nr:hypothetical protein C5167_001028 [Papaver somniferum]